MLFALRNYGYSMGCNSFEFRLKVIQVFALRNYGYNFHRVCGIMGHIFSDMCYVSLYYGWFTSKQVRFPSPYFSLFLLISFGDFPKLDNKMFVLLSQPLVVFAGISRKIAPGESYCQPDEIL